MPKGPRDHIGIVRDPREPPPDRGRLMTAEAVAAEIFGNQVSIEWVKRNVKGEGSGRLKLGHSTVRFWEFDVRRWLESRRDR